MAQDELDRLESDLLSGKMTAKEAISLLIKDGKSRDRAWESIFLTLGGDDIIEANAEGVPCYRCSGMPVDEVLAKMRQ